MNWRDAIAFAGFAVVIGRLVFNEGKNSERFDRLQKQTKEWADGLGKLSRANSAKTERRWMLQLADDVEIAETKEQRQRIAIRIREEVWRS